MVYIYWFIKTVTKALGQLFEKVRVGGKEEDMGYIVPEPKLLYIRSVSKR